MPKIKTKLSTPEEERDDERKAPAAEEWRRWRTKSGKTQREAAEWLKVPLRTYQKWESGERTPAHPGPLKLRKEALRTGKE